MKTTVLILMILSSASAFARGGGHRSSSSSHHVRAYHKKDGTFVQAHNATNPNGSKLDNYSTKGNTNPYTGKAGTVDP